MYAPSVPKKACVSVRKFFSAIGTSAIASTPWHAASDSLYRIIVTVLRKKMMNFQSEPIQRN